MWIVPIFFLEAIIVWLNRIHHLFGGDSAEFMTVANTWSIAHPPGYPLYSFLANLIRILHIDSSLTFLSIVPTVLTSVLIYKILLLFKKSKIVAIIPAVLYIFLFPIWLYAEVPEVFALNNLFIAFITYYLLKAYYNRACNLNLWIFFIFGLSLTNHQTIILYLPGWFFLMRRERIRQFIQKKTTILKSLILTMLGLSFYIYAPIASLFHPVLDFENAKTLDGIWRLITRSTYGTFRSYMGSKPDLLTQFLGLCSSFVYILLDFRIIGVIFILLGLVFLYKRHREVFTFAVSVIIAELVFFFYINFTLIIAFGAATFERFLISYYFILVLLFGFGFIFLSEKIVKIRIENTIMNAIKNSCVSLFGVLFIIVIFFSNFNTVRYVKSIDNFDSYAKDILDSLPSNALLATTSDNSTFTVDYYYFVHSYRPDIKLLSVGIFNRAYYRETLKKSYPDLDYKSLSRNNLNDFIKDNSSRYPIFFETPSVAGFWVPYGLTWKYYPSDKQAKADSENIINANEVIWQKLHIPEVNAAQSNIYHLKALKDDYLGKMLFYAKYLFSLKKDELVHKYTDKLLSYDKNNRAALGLLMWIQSRNNDCREAKKTYTLFNKDLNAGSISELKDALSYFFYCDKTNPQANKLIDQYRLIDTKSDQPSQYQFTK